MALICTIDNVFLNYSPYDGSRSAITSIYYLINGSNVVPWHQLLSESIFFWHKGTVMVSSVQKHEYY